MNFNQLKYISAIADEMSMSKAAQKLFISQPSLSQCVHSVEKELGVKLFDRSKNTLKLTYAGEVFIDWTKMMLFSTEQIKRKMADIAVQKNVKLIIGISPYRSSYVLPPVISKFKQLYPDCNLVIEEHPTSILHEMFEDEKIDILIDTPYQDTISYTSIPISYEKIMLVTPPNWDIKTGEELNGYPVIELADIQDKQFIMLSNEQLLGKVTRNACEQNGFMPKIALECRNIETAHSMVLQNVGAAFIPEFFLKYGHHSDKVKYYSIKDFEPGREFCVIFSNERYLPKAAKKFIEILKEFLLK